MMKKLATTALLATVTMSSAYANEVVSVPVLEATPIYMQQQVISGYTTSCVKERIYDKRETSVLDGPANAVKGDGGSLAGAIIGGVVGNQFGGGDGKTAMTIIGSVIGSNIGNNTSKQHHSRVVTVCDDVPQYTTKQVLMHYMVSYMFNGRMYTVKMKNDPGAMVDLVTNTTHSVRN
jgi:uncharacterized protein YcfJ